MHVFCDVIFETINLFFLHVNSMGFTSFLPVDSTQNTMRDVLCAIQWGRSLYLGEKKMKSYQFANLVRGFVVVCITLLFAYGGFLMAQSTGRDDVYTVDNEKPITGEIPWYAKQLVVDTGAVEEVTFTSVYPIDVNLDGYVLDLIINEHGRYQVGPFPMGAGQLVNFKNLEEKKALYVSLMSSDVAVVKTIRYDDLHKAVLNWLFAIVCAALSFTIVTNLWKKKK